MKPRNVTIIFLATAAILAIPLIAMPFTDEVNWTLSDFIVAGMLLAGTGLLYEFAASKTDRYAYRVGIGVVLGTMLILVWGVLAT